MLPNLHFYSLKLNIFSYFSLGAGKPPSLSHVRPHLFMWAPCNYIHGRIIWRVAQRADVSNEPQKLTLHRKCLRIYILRSSLYYHVFFPEIVTNQNTFLYPAEALLIIIPKTPFCYGRVSSQSSSFCLLLLDLSGYTCWVLSYSRPRTYMLLVAIEIRFQISHPRFRLSLTPYCSWPYPARVHTSTHTRSFCHYHAGSCNPAWASLVWLHFYRRVAFSHSIILSSHQPLLPRTQGFTHSTAISC